MAITKPAGYDELATKTEFEPLPPGGYVCKILGAKEAVSSKGNEMIVVTFDIAEGDYKDYFHELYLARKAASDEPLSVKFPYDAYAYILPVINGEPNSTFKSFNTSIEESGGTIVWGDKYCESIKGATVGVLFGREESKADNGMTFWNTKPKYYRSVETIRNGKFSVPKDKPLKPEDTTEAPPGFHEVSDEEIPF